jgi:hypothetical protein
VERRYREGRKRREGRRKKEVRKGRGRGKGREEQEGRKGRYVRGHCNENPINVFLFWELRGLSPNFHIHVSVSDLYIPHIWLKQNRQTDPGNI